MHPFLADSLSAALLGAYQILVGTSSKYGGVLVAVYRIFYPMIGKCHKKINYNIVLDVWICVYLYLCNIPTQ